MQIFSVLEFLFCLKADSMSEMRLEKARGNKNILGEKNEFI